MADSDNESGPAGDFVGLADAVAALRGQLSEVTSAPTAAGPRFKIAEIDMEFLVEPIAGTDGQVKFWVVGAGADGKVASLACHRVTIKLTPAEEEGRPTRIGRGWDEGDRLG
jgi:hypothetical protein